MQALSTTKKSKPGRVVPSRYKQSALQKATTRDNTQMNFNLTKNSMASNESDFLDVTTMAWGKTPSSGSRNDYMSTPAVSHVAAPMCDASAISVDQSCMPILMEPLVCSNVKQRLGGSRAKAERTSASAMSRPKPRRKELNEDFEVEIDICYARYLQAVFLESKAKKALNDRAENAMEDLHKLWLANQSLMKQEASQEQQYNCLQYVKQLVDFCKEKKQIYDPIMPFIADVLDRYERLHVGVDSMKRKLSIPNVIFTDASCTPENLIDAAEECVTLLRKFEQISIENRELPMVADLLAEVCKLRDEIDAEQTRCLKLAASTDHLMLSESFLKIASICPKEEL